MKTAFLFFALVLASSIFGSEKEHIKLPVPGDLISSSELPVLPCPDGSQVTSFKLIYRTLDTKGALTIASGLFIAPISKAKDAVAMVSYQHGTIVDRAAAPSNGTPLTQYIGCRYAQKSMISMADYLGFGESTTFHPYHHSDTTASAAIDMIKASMQFAGSRGIEWNSKLFLSGYSQGGHATMALLKALGEGKGPWDVTATAALSGAYDLSDTSFKEMLKLPKPFDGSVYVGYLLSAYRELYPDALVNSLVKPASVAFIDAFITHDLAKIKTLVPMFPRQLFSDEALKDLSENENHPFIQALARNNVYNFVPISPVLLCYGGADTSVPPKNSLVAYDRLKGLGADVNILNVGDDLDHAKASSPCENAAAAYFNKF